MAQITLIDIAKRTGNDALVGLIEENLNVAPEMQVFPARSIPGTSFKTVVRTTLPTVSFRSANAATAPVKSLYAERIFECFILSGVLSVDKAVADADPGGAASLKTDEGLGVIKAAMQQLGKQIWYGRDTTYGGDAAGFPGAMDAYDATNMFYDAGGTTATTGSSVWMVKFGIQDGQVLFGNGGSITLAPWTEQLMPGTVAGTYTPSYVSNLTAWCGLQFANPNKTLVRGKDFTAAEAAANCSDAHLGKMLAKFPAGVMPDAIFMSRRSFSQLWASRTVTVSSINGARVQPRELIGPRPTDFQGVPIYQTDSLSDVEVLS